MDLEPIEERANEFATWVGKFDSTQRIPAAFSSAADVPALLAEVERLRAEVARIKAEAWDEGAVFGVRDQHGTVDTYIRDAIERHNPYRAAEGGDDRG